MINPVQYMGGGRLAVEAKNNKLGSLDYEE